jgi:hypothetical protein
MLEVEQFVTIQVPPLLYGSFFFGFQKHLGRKFLRQKARSSSHDTLPTYQKRLVRIH